MKLLHKSIDAAWSISVFSLLIALSSDYLPKNSCGTPQMSKLQIVLLLVAACALSVLPDAFLRDEDESGGDT